MATISYADSLREIEALDDAIAGALDDEAAVAATEAALAHPCAAHQMQVTELWTDLAELHRQARRYDDAIAAYEAAMAAGLRSAPHPLADVATLLLEAGRRDDAAECFEQVRTLTPDDIWLANSAGDAYAMAGDHAEALRWIDAGVDLALATGDPEELLGQLMEMRASSLAQLGRPIDDPIAARVAAFTPGPPEGAYRYYGKNVPMPESCDHCGWTRADDPLSQAVDAILASRGEASAPPSEERPASASPRDGVLDGREGSPAPVRSPSVGRNEPCPCGSGQKYKRCHGR